MKSDTMFDFWKPKETDRTLDEINALNDDIASFFLDTPPQKDDDDSLFEERFMEDSLETGNKRRKGDHKKSKPTSGRKVIEYENWIGRVVDIEESMIGARITNSLNLYSPRYVRIERSFFASKGVSHIEFGDEFELSFQSVRVGKSPIKYEKNLRMIQHVLFSKEEIDQYVESLMRDLNK